MSNQHKLAAKASPPHSSGPVPRAVSCERPTTSISEHDFETFREFFYRKTGISFDATRRYFVDRRLLDRMGKTGHDTFRSYFTFVRYQTSGVECQELVNSMTVNETYFFREDYQFECLAQHLLPEIRKRHPTDSVRIWSMPCASGEEPYSIALHLLEYWKDIEAVDVEIYATDIDSEMISKCKTGIYSQRSVQYIPRDVLLRHFTALPDTEYQISEALRLAINFRCVNLVDNAETKSMRDIDVAFCRNLLIYFDEASRQIAAEALFDALRPGGYLLLGHSESFSRCSSLFRVQKFPQGIVYQKPL